MWDVQKFMFSQDLYLSGMHYWDKSAYINNVAWGSYPKPTNIHSNTSFEQIYVFVKPGKTRSIDANLLNRNLLSKDEWRHWAVRCIWDDISPVIKINSKGENNFGHTAPFPEDIPYRLIRMHTVEGEIVLDPFLGSGTTLKVCRLTNRNGIGYEINADYKDRILQRIDETWEPPSIDSIYLSMGLEKLKAIIETTINTTLSSKNQNETNQIDYNELLAHVAKQLSKEKLLSKNIIKKLTNNSEDEE
jgi:DNA modification methylase